MSGRFEIAAPLASNRPVTVPTLDDAIAFAIWYIATYGVNGVNIRERLSGVNHSFPSTTIKIPDGYS